MDSFSFDQSTLQAIYLAEGWMIYPQVIIAWCVFAAGFYIWDRSRTSIVSPRGLLSGLRKAATLSAVRDVCQADRKTARSRLSRVVVRINQTLATSGSPVELEGVIEDSLEDTQISLERWLGYLHVAAQASMLTGLLGTVLGLYSSFMVIGSSNVAPQPSQLADGVSQALMTTIVGLIVAIPALVLLTHLQGRASRCLHQFREAINQILPHLRKLHATADTPTSRHEVIEGVSAVGNASDETAALRRNGHATGAADDQRNAGLPKRSPDPEVSSPSTRPAVEAPPASQESS